MKKLLAILFVNILCATVAHAVVVQKVYLKNGTVLNGYIQQQDDNDNITFRTDDAVICVPGDNATTTERVYRIGELDKKWIEWAEKNDAFVGTGDNRTLALNEILFKQQSNSYNDSVSANNFDNFENDFRVRHANVAKVKVLEKGVTIKYLELLPNTYTFNWSDVESIKAERRSKTALSGIDRVYQLKNGVVQGQYAGESYNTLSIYTANGMIETFDIDKVLKCTYKAVNPNQSLFEQSELEDVVRTKNGGTFRGVIVERDFTDNNNYLIIQQSSGASQLVKFADVAQYSKEENKEYSPKYDILLKEGEVVINRVATDSVGVTKRGSALYLDRINHKVVVPKGEGSTKISVEYYNPQHLSSDHLILLKVDNKTEKKKKVYFFSTDLYEMKKFSAQGVETSVNNTTKIDYVVTGSGVYALYDQNTRKAMPFIVK